jgi:hypothetical protein
MLCLIGHEVTESSKPKIYIAVLQTYMFQTREIHLVAAPGIAKFPHHPAQSSQPELLIAYVAKGLLALPRTLLHKLSHILL